jgi:Leucine-rich repeat (LRR) protein
VQQLDLGRNKLSAREVCDLLAGAGAGPPFSILRLLLPYNLVDSIPASLALHTDLRELQLSFNKLTSLELLDCSRLPHLTILDVSNNQIARLGNVHRARALQTLLLENNELRHVPPELALLEQVTTTTTTTTATTATATPFFILNYTLMTTSMDIVSIWCL